jgi:hypothetical protein
MKENAGGEGEGVNGFLGTSHRQPSPISGVRKRRGAPPGNKRAFKHGRYSHEVLSLIRQITDWKRSTRAILAEVEGQLRKPRRKRKRKI